MYVWVYSVDISKKNERKQSVNGEKSDRIVAGGTCGAFDGAPR
jgi:hypothetical protein